MAYSPEVRRVACDRAIALYKSWSGEARRGVLFWLWLGKRLVGKVRELLTVDPNG
jgi:hypothetical protein